MKINSYEDFCFYQNVSRETYDKFKLFEETLIKWQRSINLISKSTINDIGFDIYRIHLNSIHLLAK